VEYDASLENWRGRGVAREFRESRGAEAFARRGTSFIESENRYQAIHDDSVLPQGVIHGDFFHDNVLWDDAAASAVIDFYFACDYALLYDVAIGVNDWCVNRDAPIDTARAHAFIEGYASERPIEELRARALAGDAAARGAAHLARAASATTTSRATRTRRSEGPRGSRAASSSTT